MRNKEIKEGLADLAQMAEQDHEVQMARAELYKLAKYSIKLHEMLKGVSEREGLEGWVQSKITKAADYVSSVYHHLDYDMNMGEDKEISEKAVSKKQQKFMGMVHAAQKGEKSASPEVEKVAKSMKKSDAKDFAKTKHKGLPDKVTDAYINKLQNSLIEKVGRDNFNNTKRDFAPTKSDAASKAGTAAVMRSKGEGRPQLVDKMVSTNQNWKDKQAKLDKTAKNTAKSAGVNPDTVLSPLKPVTAQNAKFKDKFRKTTESKDAHCTECGKPSYTTLPEEKQKGVDGKVCWKGYKRMGTKKKGGKTVDNCVKM